jgi:hypothetical protein
MILVSALAVEARATIYTQLADWNYTAFSAFSSANGQGAITGFQPGIQNAGSANNGVTYIFQTNTLPATAPQPFVSLGALLLNNVTDPAGNIYSTTNSNTVGAVFVFALQGTFNPTSGVATFSSGAYAIEGIVNGTSTSPGYGFKTSNLSTWGYLGTTASPTSLNLNGVVAYGGLESPQVVLSGLPGTTETPDSNATVGITNQVKLNGTLDTGSAVANLTSLGGLITNVTNYSVPGGVGVAQGLFLDNIQETIGQGPSFPSPQLTTAQNFYNNLFALSGQSSPGFIPSTDDFSASFNATIAVPDVAILVPEPASLIVWVFVLASCGLAYFRLARKK